MQSWYNRSWNFSLAYLPSPWAEISKLDPLYVFVSKILLEHSQAHAFTCCLDFLHAPGEVEYSCDRDHMALKAKIFIMGSALCVARIYLLLQKCLDRVDLGCPSSSLRPPSNLFSSHHPWNHTSRPQPLKLANTVFYLNCLLLSNHELPNSSELFNQGEGCHNHLVSLHPWASYTHLSLGFYSTPTSRWTSIPTMKWWFVGATSVSL